MKKIDYMKPAVRVKIVMFESAFCESLYTSTEDEVDNSEGGGAWSKDFEDDFAYPTGGSVWSD